MFLAGGLDETLHSIIDTCQARRVPLIFALGRRALGRACAKPVPVSVVGIFGYDGLEVGSRLASQALYFFFVSPCPSSRYDNDKIVVNSSITFEPTLVGS